MLEKLKGEILFRQLLKRPDINKAYAMVKPTDSWYDTITKVHNSLAQIQKMPHDVLEIVSHDQIRLKGMYYPCGKNSNVTVICIHGYTSHAEREWAFPGLFYLSLGYNVLIPYQRAHGLSGGKYISLGALERVDMLGWVDKINELNPDGSIIIHGLSMGGGIALDLCAKEMKNGNMAARERLIQSYIPMVAGHIKHTKSHLQNLGLVLYCVQALEKAVDSFDFMQENETFSHRLSWWLRQAVANYIVK
jgi:alpha-beta hydrolase superfamily lysophospholipase